nr:MAG TPA: hypothetical protein [Caudoviricetes sp.]
MCGDLSHGLHRLHALPVLLRAKCGHGGFCGQEWQAVRAGVGGLKCITPY